jgi:hypothetical protein
VYDHPHIVIIIIIVIIIVMSAGYASRLLAYPNKGLVGLPEFRETQRALHHKLQKLTELVRKSQHLVMLTGAGISTSAGIPDCRGPNGIWTMEKQQQTTSGGDNKRKSANKKTKNETKKPVMMRRGAQATIVTKEVRPTTKTVDFD